MMVSERGIATMQPTVTALLAAVILTLAACGGGRQASEPADPAPAASEPTVEETSGPEMAERADDGEAGLDGYHRDLSENPFEFAWDLELPAGVTRTWLSPAIKGLLFVQLESGEIQGIDVYSGITQWVTRPLPKPIRLDPYVHSVRYKDGTTGQTFEDRRFYVISGDQLFAFDAEYGQLIWRHHLGQTGPYGFQPSSGPFAIGNAGNLRVFVGDWEGRIQVIAFHEAKQRAYVIWQWNLQAPPTAQANGQDDLTYVGDHNGKLSCFGLDREMLWQYDAGAPIMGSPYVRGRSVYVGSDDEILHVLNRLTGEELGTLYIGAPIRRQPFAYHTEGRRLYAFTAGDETERGLRCFTTADDNVVLVDAQEDYEKSLEVSRMAEEWFTPGLHRLVASSPDRLYARRENQRTVIAIDRRDGTADWHWDVQAEHAEPLTHIVSYQDPTDEIRAVVVVDAANIMTAYRLFGAETRE